MMQILSPLQIADTLRREYGLNMDPFPPASTEFLSCALRHTASRISPCLSKSLVSATETALAPLQVAPENNKNALETTLEAMVAYGDFLELHVQETEGSQGSGGQRPLLYLAAPMFVQRHSGGLLLIGFAPDEVQRAPELHPIIRFKDHVRLVEAGDVAEIMGLLDSLGYYERPEAQWMRCPPISNFEDLIRTWTNHLAAANISGAIPDLKILNTGMATRNYLARWTAPKNMSGNFVGRRPQRYGADLWCYVELHNGVPKRFVDIPFGSSMWRGSDEAWHLQAALDAAKGSPQEAHTVPDNERVLLKLHAPVPAWIQRRFDATGVRVQSRECLFAYAFKQDEINQEAEFLRRSMWMKIVSG